MSRANKPQDEPATLLQLTAEESAEIRREVQGQIDRARSEGVYDRLLRWAGKIDLPPVNAEGK